MFDHTTPHVTVHVCTRTHSHCPQWRGIRPHCTAMHNTTNSAVSALAHACMQCHTHTHIDRSHATTLCHTVPTHARASVTTYYCAHITTTTSNNAMTAMHACQCLLLNVKWRALHVITCRMTDGATIATSCAPTVVDASNTTHMHIACSCKHALFILANESISEMRTA
jgi:hypothetical protein